MHVDRLFDVGLHLIEELARHPPFPEPRGGGWMGHRWPLASFWVPLWARGFTQIRAAGDHASGYSLYNYSNLWWLFTASNHLTLLSRLFSATQSGSKTDKLNKLVIHFNLSITHTLKQDRHEKMERACRCQFSGSVHLQGLEVVLVCECIWVGVVRMLVEGVLGVGSVSDQ